MKYPPDWRLYLVTDRGLARGRAIAGVVEAAVRGGATAVQLREKNCETREFVELGRELKKLLGALEVPLIVNDRVDVAIEIGADGVHIGQQDMEYERARKVLGRRPSSVCRSRQSSRPGQACGWGSTISAWGRCLPRPRSWMRLGRWG